MKNRRPMGLNSTLFISYGNIDVDEIDIYEDAMDFNSEFLDVINQLGQIKIVPEKRLTQDLIDKIRKQN